MIDILIYNCLKDCLNGDSDAHKLMDVTEWSALKKIAILNFSDYCDQGKDTTVMIKFMKSTRKPEIKHKWSRLCRAGLRRKKENQTYFPLDYHAFKKSWYSSWFMIFIMIYHNLPRQFPPCVSFGHAITGSMVYDGCYKPKT